MKLFKPSFKEISGNVKELVKKISGYFNEVLTNFKENKKMLGNFPQAYSHLALIETAMNFNS